jgi:membrane protein
MKLKEIIIKLGNITAKDVGEFCYKKFPPHTSFIVKQLYIIVFAFRKYKEDDLRLRASSLAFLSMMSVVPFVAMGFGIAKGFGFDQYLKTELVKYFKGQEKVLDWVMQFANAFLSSLEETKGGVIAGVGVAFLIWTIVEVFGNIEESFNTIWHIKTGRTWTRKLTDYISLMILVPVLFIIQSTATVYITYQIHSMGESFEILGYIAPFATFAMKLTPFIIVWFLFALMYIVMPNTQVKFTAGIIAGIIAGTVFQMAQWVYIRFQIGMSSYNAIYGSFAALPLFMIWLNWSWIIVLIGTEISYANQSGDKDDFFSKPIELSLKSRKLTALLISHFIIRCFAQGRNAPNASEISEKLNIPLSLTSDILYQLVACGIISEVVTGEASVYAYQPARDINGITILSVTEMIENHGSTHLTPSSDICEKLSQYQEAFLLSIQNLPENKLLRDI